MTSRSASLLLIASGILLVVAFGCGGGTSSVGPVASAVSTASAANGQSTALHGPPAGWEGRPPFHVHRFLASTPVGYSPSQIRTAYGITGTGAGQTIAIVDAYGSPTIANDLKTFCTQFGLSQASLTIAYPSGKVRQTSSGWALETSLDVEWAHAVAPGATILLVVAKSASLNDLLTAVDYAAKHGACVVSMSWGGSEWSGETGYDSHFQMAGVTFVASSGDSGAGAGWPAVSQYVTGVGGTSLTTQSNGTYISETAWSGSGGGPSAYVPVPAYQQSWHITGTRETPDVALDADPYTGVAVYDSTKYNGMQGWFQVGGTSLGSPVWAGLIALANQAGGTFGGSSLSANLNTALYSIGSSSYATDFHDITSGSNGYSATSGYDEVTGIGTPQAGTLVTALAGY
jgi:subtilase family serine protease